MHWNDCPAVLSEPITIQFSPYEAKVLWVLCQKVAGTPTGPRGVASELSALLFEVGASRVPQPIVVAGTGFAIASTMSDLDKSGATDHYKPRVTF